MPPDTTSLDFQVHLITGATSGIGLETARALARRGATVVIAGRDEKKAQRVVAEIREETGEYFKAQAPARSGAASYDLETARRLWDIGARMAGLDQEEPT